MRAAYLHNFGDLRVGEAPDPVPGPGEVVIDVVCVQPSVTECMLIAGHRIALHHQLAERLRGGPVMFGGHEFAGIISGVGSEVSGLRPGQRVTAVETVACGACTPCRRGTSSACIQPQFLGFTRTGAFAERVVVPAVNVVPVPDGVSASAVAAIQPLAGALHAHAAGAVQPGESILVIGAGVMGLMAVQVARHGNGGLVIVAGRSQSKLDLAARFGADVTIGASEDVTARTMEMTDGVGVDLVFETAGGVPSAGLAGDATMTVAANAVRRSGRIVVVSVLPDDAHLPVGRLRERSVTLLHPSSGAGGYSPGSNVFNHALRLVARGDVDVESLVTHRLDGLASLPEAVDITLHKSRYGAINPAQLTLSPAWDAT